MGGGNRFKQRRKIGTNVLPCCTLYCVYCAVNLVSNRQYWSNDSGLSNFPIWCPTLLKGTQRGASIKRLPRNYLVLHMTMWSESKKGLENDWYHFKEVMKSGLLGEGGVCCLWPGGRYDITLIYISFTGPVFRTDRVVVFFTWYSFIHPVTCQHSVTHRHRVDSDPSLFVFLSNGIWNNLEPVHPSAHTKW